MVPRAPGVLHPALRFSFPQPVHSRLWIKLADDPATEADRDGMRARAGLKLGKQVTYVGLHRFLGQEQPLSDLAVHEPLGDELQHLDLTHGGYLLELA